MKFFSSIISLSFVGLVRSLDMSRYKEGPGIDAGFRNYVSELYHSTEDPAVTTAFSDFFVPNGRLIVRNIVATGASEIIALKLRLLPPAGNKHWNHVPNVTTVDSESSTQKVYQVLGVIQSTYDGGNCSQAYYSTRFTVKKEGGVLSFRPRAGNLILYDDFIVDPAGSPTAIPCD